MGRAAPKSVLISALAICWLASSSHAWSTFMGPALSRPTKSAGKATLYSSFGPNDQDVTREGEPLPSKSSGSSFSFANLFSGKEKSNSAATATAPTLRGRSKALEPHPSVRPHISPLNRLGPDFDNSQIPEEAGPLPMHPDVRSGTLPNGFSYVILPNKSPPGRFEAHLQVFSGSGTLLVSLLTRNFCTRSRTWC